MASRRAWTTPALADCVPLAGVQGAARTLPPQQTRAEQPCRCHRFAEVQRALPCPSSFCWPPLSFVASSHVPTALSLLLRRENLKSIDPGPIPMGMTIIFTAPGNADFTYNSPGQGAFTCPKNPHRRGGGPRHCDAIWSRAPSSPLSRSFSCATARKN